MISGGCKLPAAAARRKRKRSQSIFITSGQDDAILGTLTRTSPRGHERTSMSRKHFQFEHQPILERLQSEQQAWETSVAEARREVERESAILADFEARWRALVQQLDTARDNFARRPSGPRTDEDLSNELAYAEALRHDAEEQAAHTARQRDRVAAAVLRREVRTRELNALLAKIAGLRRLRELALRKHLASVEAMEEADADEDAIQRFGRD